MPEEDDYINDAGTGENAQDIDPEVIDHYYNDNNGGTGDEDPTPSEDDIISDDYFNINRPPKPSEKWQKFQRVATVLGLASAIVTLIYFITKISSK
jgi:hypothetical protein